MRRIALAALAAVYLAGCAGPQQFVQQCQAEMPYPPPFIQEDGTPLIPEDQRLAAWQGIIANCAQNYANQHNNRVAAGVALGVLAVGAAAAGAAADARYNRPVFIQRNTTIIRRY